MLVQDIRYASRIWRAHPLLMGAAVASLALGMGANTAVFSVLNATLLTSPPVKQPETLLVVYSTSASSPGLRGTSFQNYEDLRRGVPFDLAVAAPISVALSGETGQAEELSAELVSENYFELLGVSSVKFARSTPISRCSAFARWPMC